MTTSPEDPRIQAAAALVKDGARERASAYGPPSWQPIWKRPRTPKSQAQKKKELREQRKRLKEAGIRRLMAGPHRQRGRAPRCARPVPDAALHRVAVVTSEQCAS